MLIRFWDYLRSSVTYYEGSRRGQWLIGTLTCQTTLYTTSARLHSAYSTSEYFGRNLAHRDAPLGQSGWSGLEFLKGDTVMPKHAGRMGPTSEEGGTTKSMKARRGFRLGVAVALLAGAGLTGLSFVTATSAVAKPSGDTVTICHATASSSNPYVQETVDLSSLGDGHGNSGVNPGDIIPPTPNTDFPSGNNWGDISGLNATGEQIWNNGCAVPTSESSSSSAPAPTTVTPTEPMHSTPDCTSQDETVTPSSQEGVVWNPSGSTTLKPGDSVTYTASPAEGYVFPDGAQTSWTFTNGLDTSKCTTGSPTPPSHEQGTGTGTATCKTNGTYLVNVSANGLVGKNNNPNGYYQGGVFVTNGVNTVYSQSQTDANGDATFPAFTFDAKGQSSVKFYINSTTTSGGVNVAFTVDFAKCGGQTSTPPSSTPPSSPGKSHTPPATHTTSPSKSIAPPTSIGPSPSQLGPVPHTGVTVTFVKVITHPYGWAKIPGGVLLGIAGLFGLALLNRREATQR